MFAYTPELVGRIEQLAAIERFLAHPPGILVLDGEPGIGKTTVWRRGVALAEERSYRVLAATPSAAEAQLAYATLRDLLGEVFEDVKDELPAPQRRALSIALLRAEPSDHLPAQAAVAAGFLGGLRVAAQTGPVLVAVDDLQWLDSSSALVLGFAARRLRDAQITFLLSKRTGHNRPELDLERLRLGHLTEVHIGPLSLGALHKVLMGHLKAPLPRPTLRAVHEMSRGNPFYALEVARALTDRPWTPTSGQPLPVPSTLRSLVDGRIAFLPLETQDALGIAAAIGDPTLGLIGAVTGQDAVRLLGPAVTEGAVRLDDERVHLAHPLLAAAAYERMTSVRRREVHAFLSSVLHDSEERARHLALAAVGPDEDVAAALEAAAQAALARGAPHGAVELCERARDLTPTSSSENLRRRTLAQVEYCLRTGESARARELLTDVFAASSLGPLRAEALSYMGWIEFYGVDWRSSAEFYEAALVEPGVTDHVRARSEVGLANALLLLREDIPSAAEHARAAVLLSDRIGDPMLLAEALGLQAESEFLLGRGSFPRELMEQALALGPVLGSVSVSALPQVFFALILSWADEVDASLEMYKSLVVRAEELGDETLLGWNLARMALAECFAGRFVEAVRHLDEAYEIVSLTGQESNRAVVLATRALLEAHLGHVDGAREAGEEAIQIAEKVEARLAQRIARSALGFLALSRQRYAEAHEHLGPLFEETRAAGIREPSEYRFLADDIEALVALGRLGEAEDALAFFDECALATSRTSALGAARRCRALLAAANGDMGRGLAAAGDSVAIVAKVPNPFERGRSLLVLGEVRRRARQKRTARESLASALSVFEGLGAALWATKARSELTRIGGRAPAADSLTPTEQRVAELVAQGLRNHEIAAALFVTSKTVEFHLRNVFRKLDIHSRVELARWFADKA